MRRSRNLSAIALALLACFGAFHPNGRASARPEPVAGGEVVVYYSADEPFARMIFDEFERRTGVKVKGVGDNEAVKTTGLAQRIRAEKSGPKADVFWNSEALHTILLGRDGLLAPYNGEGASDRPEQWRDSGGLWHAFGLRARVFVYNTNAPVQINVHDQQRSIQTARDFWNPVLGKGAFVMARPEFGTTRAHLAAMLVVQGEGDLATWSHQMKKQRVRLVDGNAAVVRAVALHEAVGGLTDSDDVWVAKANGWPVDMIYIRHDEIDQRGNVTSPHGPILIPNTVAKVAGGPNPANADTFVAFMLSADVERMLARSASRNIPVRPEVAAEFPELAVPDAAAFDLGEAASQSERALELFREAIPE